MEWLYSLHTQANLQEMETRMLGIENMLNDMRELMTLVKEAFGKKLNGQHIKTRETDNGKIPRVFVETQTNGLDGAQTVDKGKREVDPLEAPQHKNTKVLFGGSEHKDHAQIQGDD